MTRFKPSRAGLINIWDYTDEEFVFADGRLVLRGHNGSGKTKALEVLFPFVLDGVVDARRLDPFSGENRTMKSNLLYRGQESEYGFVWMEFAAGARTVTLIIAMHAHKDRPEVKRSYFVTSRRLGVDFGLLTDDSRPLTDQQLKRVLEPEAWHTTPTDYRDAIDSALFGLGRERYTQLLDLLLALRRPLLAKDLDPGKVSDTLTAGLSPVPESLVEQAARDFDNLAAVQRQFDDLTAADGAARAFLESYADYLRAEVRFHLDRVAGRTRQVVKHAGEVAVAGAEMRRADLARGAAEDERTNAGTEQNRLSARLDGLKKDSAYTAQGELEILRGQVGRQAQEIVHEREANARAAARIADLRTEVDAADRRLKSSRDGVRRLAADRAEAARLAVIVHSDDDDLQAARAQAGARRQDVEDVQACLRKLGDAEKDRRRAEQAVDKARERAEAAEQAVETAVGELEEGRAQALDDLNAWAGRWSADSAGSPVSAGDLAVLIEALDGLGEAGAPRLAEVFGDLAETRRTTLARTAAALDARSAQLTAERDRLAALVQEIAAERDDAPALAGARRADRTARQGAALWRLVRFADDVSDADAAAIEGALDAAGLLTAWIHPDPRLTAAAVEQGEADAYLLPAPPGSRPAGATLSSVLVPEDQSHVPARIIADVLDSIALTDVFVGTATTPAVTRRGQFAFGVHLGAQQKTTAEYIGATNRAARRRARIAEYERNIEVTSRELSAAQAERDTSQARLDDVGRAKAELQPVGKDVLTAVGTLAQKSTLLAAARAEHGDRARALDGAIAEMDADRRRLRQAATDRNMPAEEKEIEVIAQAITDFLTTAELVSEQHKHIASAESDLESRRRTIASLEAEHQTARDTLAEKEEGHAGAAERLTAMEEALSAPLKEILEQIGHIERELAAADEAWQAADTSVRREHDALVGARVAYQHGTGAITGALGELLDQLAAFGPLAHPDLRPVLGVGSGTAWPDRAQWATPEQSVRDIIERLAGQDAAAAVESVLPQGTADLLRSYEEATSGRQIGEAARKRARDRMSAALGEFDDALNACEEDYRLDWQPGESVVVVQVQDADGRHPVADFAHRTAARAEEQGVLMEERERTVLEDELLAGLAQQIFQRVVAAKELVRGMDADTRSRPMSTGTTVGIRWVVADKITDSQREISELLGQDGLEGARLADMRRLLRQMIREYRAGHPRATYKEVLSKVLDYRTWRSFELRLKVPGQEEVRLSKKRHSQMSGGEKSAAIHLPLFAAANSLYSSASDTCPRLIALDEAFAGIDDVYKPDLLGLTVRYDLDAFMTGHDLWIRYETVPAAAHYDMHSDKASHTVSAMLVLWDGCQLVDSAAGFAGNEELATELLGFSPSRRVPVNSGLLGLVDDGSMDSGDGEPGDGR
ncbi:SbcC/MukB-like Walker B domain-containing protein [Planotetraspora kaengkrachanensis]|uniref:TIGR02680 family protein n=1 Tax=Planotetraspora kaengkrachanensis TaxID=575193 RepID=A0A8J3VB98_9ACTN|nr:SbcC/MukB-like Walker B domain-containing protein [Planotetraspora kaengkrachanensis]GIG83831.1 hypothetical protein Pka01_69580 [Planotetraspora kaengkrachanensis]